MIFQNEKILNDNALRDTYVITNYVLRYRRPHRYCDAVLKNTFWETSSWSKINSDAIRKWVSTVLSADVGYIFNILHGTHYYVTDYILQFKMIAFRLTLAYLTFIIN